MTVIYTNKYMSILKTAKILLFFFVFLYAIAFRDFSPAFVNIIMEQFSGVAAFLY